jgi:hypothetical protein
MSFVAHVTDTYPTSVFDVAYRPVMLTGVMLTGGSEALQNRSAALTRDAPIGFQLALGLTVSPKMPLICAILAATQIFTSVLSTHQNPLLGHHACWPSSFRGP